MKNKAGVTKQQKCIHHWIIDSPNDHMSYGKCKRCGAVAEFSNTFIRDFVERVKLPDKKPRQRVN